MIATKVILDLPTENWLEYAFAAIPRYAVTSSIIILATLCLFFVVAFVWGRCWNKMWSIWKYKRSFAIGLLAVITAACLAARDALCSGDFNSFSGGADKIMTAFNGRTLRHDSGAAYSLARSYSEIFPDQCDFSGDAASDDAASSINESSGAACHESTYADQDGESGYAISGTSLAPYGVCYKLLTLIPLLCIILLLLGVPWASDRSIRLFAPTPRFPKK